MWSHHRCSLHGVADDHDDAAFVVVQDSRRGALQELAVRAEGGAERNADATSDMASAEAGTSGVKVDKVDISGQRLGMATVFRLHQRTGSRPLDCRELAHSGSSLNPVLLTDTTQLRLRSQ